MGTHGVVRGLKMASARKTQATCSPAVASLATSAQARMEILRQLPR